MDDDGKIHLQGPLHLLAKHLFLLLYISFIPIKIDTYLAYGHIGTADMQFLIDNLKLLAPILTHRGGVQACHRVAKASVVAANLQQGLYSRRINIGHKDMRYASLLSPSNHLG